MKPLTCEMCDSTDFMKQNGIFVCQTCGMKYSLEDAKKLMAGESSGTSAPAAPAPAPAPAPAVGSPAQIENLLKLAKNAYDSKNYAQAEEFCNQVIALDVANYTAWKLKGEAINYQITNKNPRILEVYNCIMTAYRSLPDSEKKGKAPEILSSMKTCFEGEVEFWIGRFEKDRPTKAALKKVKETYVDSYNKMASVFDELDYKSSKAAYLRKFDNYFINLANSICVDAWKSTVGYNYYRDDFDNLGRNWHWSDHRWVNTDTDSYRPLEKTFDTFIEETDNLIALLKYAEEQFNEETTESKKDDVYANIIYFHERLIDAWSFKITQGYTSNWDQYKSVGWAYEYSLTDNAKSIRRKEIAAYRDKKQKNKAAEQARVAREKAEKERKEKEEAQRRLNEYWAAHAEEKAALEAEKKSLGEKLDAIEAEARKELEFLNREMASIPGEDELKELDGRIQMLNARIAGLGLFKGKEKKLLQQELAELNYARQQKFDMVDSERRTLQERIDRVNRQKAEQIAPIQKRLQQIYAELTKAR